MKVVHVSFFYDDSLKTVDACFQQQYTITGWAEALHRLGVETTVISRFDREAMFDRNGVHYYFIHDHIGPTFRGWVFPLVFLKKIKELDADVVHLHNFTLSLQTRLLRWMLPAKTAIIVQHHGGIAPRPKRRMIHNFLNNVADGFFFTTETQGCEWFLRKKPFSRILPVMEGATFFNYEARDAARPSQYVDRWKTRKSSGINGDPVFLWVGRLDPNKDPLTILDGFKVLSENCPSARLYMCYGDDKLSGEVTAKIAASSILTSSVHLLGKVDHENIEQVYNSADYFVLGSHYEGSGYALSEALRCGCIPVVTNIPSFRMMTNNGKLGALWEPGNAASFIEAIYDAIKKPIRNEADACMDFYTTHLSFDAIAQNALTHYQNVVEYRRQKLSP